MTERERLIELLNKVGESVLEFPTDNFIDSLADYLLANGVIVPPCKIGDTVYVNPNTWGGLSFIDYDHCFIYSKHFLIAEIVSIIKIRKQNLVKLKVYNRTTCTPEYNRYSISSIGKTVFLSKEEAEQALKEEQNHDSK